MEYLQTLNINHINMTSFLSSGFSCTFLSTDLTFLLGPNFPNMFIFSDIFRYYLKIFDEFGPTYYFVLFFSSKSYNPNRYLDYVTHFTRIFILSPKYLHK